MDKGISRCQYCMRPVLYELSESKDIWVHKCPTAGKEVTKQVIGVKKRFRDKYFKKEEVGK